MHGDGGVQPPPLQPHLGGGRERRPHGASPSDGTDSPGQHPSTDHLIVRRPRMATVAFQSSARGGYQWPPSGSGKANCDRDSHGDDGGGGDSTGSAAEAPEGTHSTRSRWDWWTVVVATTGSLWRPFPCNWAACRSRLYFQHGTNALHLVN